MTPQPPPPPSARTRLARSAVVLTGALLVPVLSAGPASAAVPEGWGDPLPSIDAVRTILIFVGIPVLLFVLIAAAVYVPAVVRGERINPNPQTDDEWFGGPRSDHELESGATSEETGGASARW